MNNTPFFSIVTVCFNAESTIQKTISSVLNQTYQDFEYILIDGSSTDSTLEIINKSIPLADGKMRVVSEPDNGIYDAMNKGIALARGTYIGLINSDDWYEPDALEIVFNEFSNANHTGVFYGIQNFYKSTRFFKTECVHHDFLNEAPLYHATCFISKKTYDTVGFYSTDFKLASDYEYFLRCRKFNSDFHYINKILANFSLDGSTTRNKQRSLRETYSIWLQYRIINYHQYIYLTGRVILSSILKSLLKKFSSLINIS